MFAGMLAVSFLLLAAPRAYTETPARARQQLSKMPLADLLKKADAAKKSADKDAELDAWQAIVDQYPKDPRSDAAYFYLANHHFENRNYGYANAYYSAVADQFPGSSYRTDALSGLGASLTALRRYDEADSALQAALAKASTPQQKGTALYHLGDNHHQAGHAQKAVAALVECAKIDASRREAADRKIKEILHVTANEADMLSIADKYATVYPAQFALLELARHYGKKNDLLNLEKIKARLERDFPGQSASADIFAAAPPPAPIAAPIAAPSTAAADNLAVGAVLPLSGDSADMGARALKGIQLAISMKSSFVERVHLKLVIKDAGGNPQAAATAVRELATDNAVTGVVGLFPPATLESALAESRRLILPVLSAANDDATDLPPDQKRFFYQMGFTQRDQARTIADHATRSLNLKSYAVIYPSGKKGEEMRQAFATAVEANGGVVLQSRPYENNQTDFRAQLEGIGGLDDNALRRLIFSYVQENSDKTVERLNDGLRILYQNALSYPIITKVKSQPITRTNFSFALKPAYEAVFIAGNYEQVGLILPALSFYNITQVQVLGTDGYLHPDFISITGKYAEDAVFPGEFAPSIKRQDVKNFVETYESALGGKPDATTARYYDAMMLLLSLIESGNDSKGKVAAALDTLPYYGGVSGGVYAPSEGIMEKIPSIFTIKNGAVMELQPPSPPPAKTPQS